MQAAIAKSVRKVFRRGGFFVLQRQQLSFVFSLYGNQQVSARKTRGNAVFVGV